MGNTRVDTAAVYAAAQRFDAAADLLDSALRTHLAGLGFGGSTAGRAHTARGEAVGIVSGALAGQLAEGVGGDLFSLPAVAHQTAQHSNNARVMGVEQRVEPLGRVQRDLLGGLHNS